MLVEGGGGSKPKSNIGIGGSLGTGVSKNIGVGGSFSIAQWREEEEERKRREAAEKQAAEEQRILKNERQQRQNTKLLTSNVDADSSYFRARSQEVRDSIVKNRNNDRNDPITQYWRIARSMGQEKLAQRVAAVAESWMTRNPLYNGSDVVWELVRSPYSIEEIDLMVEAAHGVLYGDRGRLSRQMDIDDLKVDFRNKYNLNSRQWQAFEQVFKAQEEAEIPTDPVTGFMLLSMLIPGGQVAGAGIAARTAGTLLKVAQFGGKMSAVTMGVSELYQSNEAGRVAGIDRKEAKAERTLQEASNPLGMEASPMATISSFTDPTPFEQMKNLRGAMIEWNKTPESREDIVAIQKELQSEGIGADLEPTGLFDGPWQSAVIDAAQEVTRQVFEQQRMAIEDGDAPYWAEIDGKLDTPEWEGWMADREKRLAENEERKASNPDRYAFFEQAGIPTTKLGLEAFGTKLVSNGVLQAAYGSLLTTAMMIGQTWQAAGSAVNLYARQSKDPTYQRALKNLLEYVDNKDFQPSSHWSKKPDEASERFARIEIAAGGLKDDPKAQELLAVLDGRQAALIQERYDPDYLLTMGYALGGDYEQVRQYGIEHPDIVRAFTTGVDIVTAMANPVGKAYRAAVKPKVAPTLTAWKGSARAKQMVNRVSNYLLAKDPGRASSYTKGTGAMSVLKDAYGFTSTKKGGLKVDPRSKVVRELSREIVDAVDDGAPGRVGKLLDGAPDEFVDSVVALATEGASKTGLTRVEQRNWVGAQLERTIIEDKVGAFIAKRQSAKGDAISSKVLSERLDTILGKAYADGADIFPYLRDNRLSAPNRPLAFFAKAISENVSNPWLRSFLTKTTVGQVVRAPTSEIEFKGLNTLDRIYDAAMVVSQDVAWAWRFRNRWAAASSESHLRSLATELDAKFKERYRGGKTDEGLTFGDRAKRFFSDESEAGGQALAPDPLMHLKSADEQRFLTEYGHGQNTRQAVPDTVYQAYTTSLHRSALWAPYRVPKDAGLLASSIVNAKNIFYRGPLWSAHRLSTPLRQVTVAMGAPLLFQKHALTDSFRTVMEESPFSLLEAAGLSSRTIKGHKVVPQIRSSLKKRMDAVMAEIPANLRDEILYQRARVHASEAQWLSGTRRQVYRAKTIRDADGKIVNLEESAQAVRRVVEGKAFREWARGGDEAVSSWLDSREGKQFLREGGWYDRAKNLMVEQGLEVKDKTKEIGSRAKTEYMESIVRQEFNVLDTALSGMMPTLKRMSLNNETLSIPALKKLIQENPHDNATLSMPAEISSGSTMAGYIVGKAMSANKWNRDVVFDHVFLRQYNKLRKEGIEAEKAATVASTVAELNTARIHFDLSNALAIEARHRWLAWFATKHRLFGTYIMKLAAERPMLAGAAMEIRDWMEERNERLGNVGEFDRYDLVIPTGDGGQYRFNLAPLMWFSEYPLESSLALALERGASYVAEEGLGMELHPLMVSPTPFGMSFTRGDALIITIGDVLKSKDVDTPEKLTEWLDSLPSSRRTRWYKLINNQRAVAAAQGKELTPLDAFGKAKAGALQTELWATFKVYSGRKVGPEKLEIEQLLEEFSRVSAEDPEKARDMLRDNEVLQAALNASTDPVKKAQRDEGFRVFNQLVRDYEMKIEEADANGTLISDYRDLAAEFSESMDKLTNPQFTGSTYNPEFAKYFGDYNPQEFIDSLGIIMPLVPSDSVWALGRKKTDKEVSEYKRNVLEPQFQSQLADYGLTPNDDSVLLYQLLQEEYIEKPLGEWTGETSYDMAPYAARNVARYLARGGESGVYKADAFLSLVRNQTFREWMGKGIQNGAATQPFMAYMTQAQKDLIGWNSDPETVQAWREYAVYDWAVRKWAKETEVTDEKGTHTVSTSSNLYKETRVKIMDSLVADLMTRSPGFANEYNFSQLKLHERLLSLGVGSGTDEESKGMNDFLTLVTDMWAELGQADNPNSKKPGVGPSSQTGGPIVKKYAALVAQLAKENDKWWQMFRGTYALSKFGFSTLWRLDDPKYSFLYWGEEDVPIDYEAETSWYE